MMVRSKDSSESWSFWESGEKEACCQDEGDEVGRMGLRRVSLPGQREGG